MDSLEAFLNDRRKLDSVSQAVIPTEPIMVLEVLLRQSPAMRFSTTGTKSGGSFYSDKHSSKLPQGLAVHHGWYQSVRTVDGNFHQKVSATEYYRQILLNVDVAATCFYQSGPLEEVVTEFFGRRDVRDLQSVLSREGDRKKLGKYLNNVSVNITYTNQIGRRRYKINGITPKPADATQIDVDGVMLTVAQYFKKTHGITLKYPWLPCIISGSGRVMIPFELCSVRPNQRNNGKVVDDVAAEMAFPINTD